MTILSLDVPWDFVICAAILEGVTGPQTFHRTSKSQWNVKGSISNFSISTDDLAPTCARASAGTVITKFRLWRHSIYLFCVHYLMGLLSHIFYGSMVWLSAWLDTGHPGLDGDGLYLQQVYPVVIGAGVYIRPILDQERIVLPLGKHRLNCVLRNGSWNSIWLRCITKIFIISLLNSRVGAD